MSTARWVIGRGLLGSALSRATADTVFQASVPWDDPDAASETLRDALGSFVSQHDGPLQIAWCAGRGVTSTPAELLQREVDVFVRFLDAVRGEPTEVRERLTIFLASSVGGAYGGSASPPFTEQTVPVPASEYGRAKLRMEEALRTHTTTGGWRAFIGRITNLYGPGQTLGKGQGLISVVVASSLLDRPVPVYVSLDTLRDYIYEDDCARVIDAGMRRAARLAPGTTVVKIIGAMTALSVGAILAENRRVRGRRFPIILGGGDPRGQSLDLRVRSEVWTDLDGLARTTLSEGLDAIYRAQLARLARHGV